MGAIAVKVLRSDAVRTRCKDKKKGGKQDCFPPYIICKESD